MYLIYTSKFKKASWQVISKLHLLAIYNFAVALVTTDSCLESWWIKILIQKLSNPTSIIQSLLFRLLTNLECWDKTIRE